MDVFNESVYSDSYNNVAGVDEVGRGPLAGPVITAAVILPPNLSIEDLTDSKKLSSKQRELIAPKIKQQAIAWSIGEASVEEIDTLNILGATMLAMQRAVSALSVKPDRILVDGNRLPDFEQHAQAIVKGDLSVACISAASIIAKVHRDHLMCELAKQYPGYGFEKNAGYPTKAHRLALQSLGVSPVHRRSFAPVAACLARSHSL